MNLTAKRLLMAGSGVLLVLTALLAPGLPWSDYCHYKLEKIRLKMGARLASWSGQPPRPVSVAGNVAAAGARVEFLYAPAGWAALSDRQGDFSLPEIKWYPGASYEVVVATDLYHIKRLKVAAPESLPDSGVLGLGALRLAGGEALERTPHLGANSTTYLEYDHANYEFYKGLYDQLSAGLATDEKKLEAICRYVAARRNQDTTWTFESPRAILERGSQYCGHLSQAMAAIAGAGGHTVRVLDLTDGATPPSPHVIVEAWYGEG